MIDDVAEELGLSKNLVDKVIDSYWSEVYEAITNLKYSEIMISNLGTFSIKIKQLDNKIENYTNYLQNENNLTFAKYHSYKTIEKQLQQMLDVKKIIDETNESKKLFIKAKRGNN